MALFTNVLSLISAFNISRKYSIVYHTRMARGSRESWTHVCYKGYI